jgi:hypothetical protein
MKATLEFELPEEKEEFTLAIKGLDYYCAITDFSNYLSKKYKHAEPPSDAASVEFEEIKNKWHDILSENDVND